MSAGLIHGNVSCKMLSRILMRNMPAKITRKLADQPGQLSAYAQNWEVSVIAAVSIQNSFESLSLPGILFYTGL